MFGCVILLLLLFWVKHVYDEILLQTIKQSLPGLVIGQFHLHYMDFRTAYRLFINILFAVSLERHSQGWMRNSFYSFFFLLAEKHFLSQTLVSKAELHTIIHAFISSRLDCCNCPFICLNKKDLDLLQSIQSAAAWLSTNIQKKTAHHFCFNVFMLTIGKF